MRINNLKLLVTSLALTISVNTHAEASFNLLDIEELRLAKLTAINKHVVDDKFVNQFEQKWRKINDFAEAKHLLQQVGTELWHKVKASVQNNTHYDDRPLYWQRLAIKTKLKQHTLKFNEFELTRLLEVFETTSRGYSDIDFCNGADKQIFITGFDPFLLDKNIEQSNPSGLAALALDGKVIEHKGQKAEINAVIVPVRYADFDHGEIESLLAPIYLAGEVDMIATISMGREHFDLERFPGMRRSVTAPDNLNILSGGSKASPVIAKLAGETLSGQEFVEFSLPVTAMQKATGEYQVIDNHQVESLEKGEHEAKTLAELKGQTAVMGGGGGYLSNEISYRSIRLKNMLDIDVPTGHIHTPRIKGFDDKTNKNIVDQIELMLRFSIDAI